MRHWRKEKQCNPLKKDQRFFHTHFSWKLWRIHSYRSAAWPGAGRRGSTQAGGRQGRQAGLLPLCPQHWGSAGISYHSTNTKMGPNPPCFKGKPHMHVHKGTRHLEHVSLRTSKWRCPEEGRAVLRLLRAPPGASCHVPAAPRGQGLWPWLSRCNSPAREMSPCHPGRRGLLSLSQNVSHSTLLSQPAIYQTSPTTAWTPLSQGFELIQQVFCLRDTAYFVQRRHLINVCWADLLNQKNLSSGDKRRRVYTLRPRTVHQRPRK